jgi:hypothetical protein
MKKKNLTFKNLKKSQNFHKISKTFKNFIRFQNFQNFLKQMIKF